MERIRSVVQPSYLSRPFRSVFRLAVQLGFGAVGAFKVDRHLVAVEGQHRPCARTYCKRYGTGCSDMRHSAIAGQIRRTVVRLAAASGVRYGFASGAASTALQAAGSCAIVIGGRGFGGSFGCLGCRTESWNQ